MTEARTSYRPPEPNGTSAIDASIAQVRDGIRLAQAHQALNSLFGRPVTVGDAVSNRLDNRSSLPGIHPTPETPIALSDIPLGPDHPSTVSGLVYAAGNHAWLDSKHHVMTDSVAQTFREKTGLDYMTTNSANLPVGGMEGDFVRSAEQRAEIVKEIEALQQKAAFAELSGPEKLSVRTLNLVLAAEQAPRNIRNAVTAFWDNVKGWIPRINTKFRVALSATASAAALAACGGAVPKPPDATPRVTTYPTATAIRPTEAPSTATFTPIPPTPTATIEASPTVRPRPTPDVKAQTVLTGTIAEKRRVLELDRTGAGSKLLKVLEQDIALGRYSDLSVFDFQQLEISNPDGTKQVMYQATINKDPNEADIKTGSPYRVGTRVVADFDYEPKNGKYIVDIDGQSLTLSTLKPAQMSGLKPSEIKIDFNFGAGEIEARGPDGQLLMTAKIKFDRAGNKGPDWKAVIGFLPPTSVVAGGIFSGTSEPVKPPPVEASATPEAKRMQAMGFTENVSVLPNEHFSNTKPLIDALRRSNPEAEKIMNDYFVSALTALIDHNPTPSASRIAEVQTKLAAARKEGKPFLVEENLQEVAGWDSEGKPLFPTPSEQAAKPHQIDFSKPVIMTFETEKDLEMRLKRGGTGSVDSRIRTAIDPKNGQLYIGVLDAPGLVDSSISAFDGNRNLALAFNTLAQPAVSLYWASDSSASKAPLVSIPKGFTNRGQAPVVTWNRAHGNDFDTKR